MTEYIRMVQSKRATATYLVSFGLIILGAETYRALLLGRNPPLDNVMRGLEWLTIGMFLIMMVLYLSGRYRVVHTSSDATKLPAYYTDMVTGLPNGRFIEEAIKAACGDLNIGSFAVITLNILRFKMINNTVGHDGADRVLVQVAERLNSALAGVQNSLLVRYSGDEFAAIVPFGRDNTDIDGFVRTALETFDEPFSVDGSEIYLHAAAGIAISPDDGNDSNSLLKCANLAMDRAKTLGANRYAHFERTMSESAKNLHELENKLHRAINASEFVLYYQPKINVEARAIAGVEALIRWNAPEGMVPPDSFIPVAEQTGLILPIGSWVLHEACRQNKEWQDKGLPPVRIAVNISQVQFAQCDVGELIRGALAATGLEAQWLEIEVTESIMFQDVDRTARVLKDIADMGIHISIDDFGTGYSSFGSLKSMPFKSLKIDKSFVRDIISSDSDATIAATIIAMANTLGLKVIAEGVEDRMQLEFLNEKNCHEMQGYYFERPLTAERFEEILRNPQEIASKFEPPAQ